MAGIGIGIGIGNAEFPGIGIGIEDLVFRVLVLNFCICLVLSDQHSVHGSKVCPKCHLQVSNLANKAVIVLLFSYLM